LKEKRTGPTLWGRISSRCVSGAASGKELLVKTILQELRLGETRDKVGAGQKKKKNMGFPSSARTSVSFVEGRKTEGRVLRIKGAALGNVIEKTKIAASRVVSTLRQSMVHSVSLKHRKRKGGVSTGNLCDIAQTGGRKTKTAATREKGAGARGARVLGVRIGLSTTWGGGGVSLTD